MLFGWAAPVLFQRSLLVSPIIKKKLLSTDAGLLAKASRASFPRPSRGARRRPPGAGAPTDPSQTRRPVSIAAPSPRNRWNRRWPEALCFSVA
jgi:hypothetical protein